MRRRLALASSNANELFDEPRLPVKATTTRVIFRPTS